MCPTRGTSSRQGVEGVFGSGTLLWRGLEAYLLNQECQWVLDYKERELGLPRNT